MSLPRIDRHIRAIRAESDARVGQVLAELTRCKHGHKLTPANLTTSGRCRTCHNINQRRSHARKPKVSQRIPAEPLAGLIYRQLPLFEDGLRGVAHHIAANLGTEDFETIESQLHHVCKPGQHILRSTADRLIIGLNSHPTNVYGPEVWEELAA